MYKIKTKGKGWKDSVIEKTYEKTITFTWQDIEQHEQLLEKTAKEIDHEMMLAAAKVKNIENNHSFIKKLTDEQQFTAHMYYENLRIVKDALEKLKAIKKQQRQYRIEKKDIAKELNLPIDGEEKK